MKGFFKGRVLAFCYLSIILAITPAAAAEKAAPSAETEALKAVATLQYEHVTKAEAQKLFASPAAENAQNEARYLASMLKEQCDARVDAACLDLAEIYYSDAYGLADPKKAMGLYSEVCLLGQQKACARLGECYRFGRGTKQNKTKGFNLETSACIYGEETACLTASKWAEEDADYKGAVRWAGAACSKDKTSGCERLGALASKSGGSLQDKEKARELLDKACKGGNKSACQKLKP